MDRITDSLWRDVVGATLRGARLARGETLDDVSRRAGVSRQYLSEVERGRKEPSSEMLAAMIGANGLSLLDLTRAVTRTLLASAPARTASPVTDVQSVGLSLAA